MARADDAREKPGVLAACLLAWSHGEIGDPLDAKVGALRIAEFVLRIENALKR